MLNFWFLWVPGNNLEVKNNKVINTYRAKLSAVLVSILCAFDYWFLNPMKSML